MPMPDGDPELREDGTIVVDALACYDYQWPRAPWIVASSATREMFCFRCGARSGLGDDDGAIPGPSGRPTDAILLFVAEHVRCSAVGGEVVKVGPAGVSSDE